ncbi:MAG: glycosyl hydrolase family 2 [Bacteroidales bacterium]|nr:glycosyl hydrolase family 2 [Bacteroidales bacterium]
MSKYIRISEIGLLISFVLSLLFCACQPSRPGVDDVYAEFRDVPDSTRTKVWWFHGETPTTRQGITADLEAFKQAGVGGVVYYDQVHGKALDADSVFSDAWWDALIFSASEAKRLGLSFEISLSNGYVAGGPWITKEMSMKRLCYSELKLSPGERYDDIFPAPATDEFWEVKTLAFPLPKALQWQEKVLVAERTRFDKPSQLVYDFGEDFTARAITYNEYNGSKHPTLCMNWPGPPSDEFYGDGFVAYPPFGTLEASSDGVHYHTVCSLPTLYRLHYREKTISFPAVTARYFRLNLRDWDVPGKHRALDLRKVTLSDKAMTETWQSRSGLQSEYIAANATPVYGDDELIHSEDIIDVSACLQADGRFTWTAPDDGRHWMVLRVAQTSTKAKTKHGRPGQMGLECDKLMAEAAILQWNSFAQVIIDSLSALGLKPLGVAMDSHEVGSQNWTHHYPQEFEALHAYSVEDYLPVLLGFVVDSKEKSEEVLFHHRQTLAHLVNRRYFAVLDSMAAAAGVRLTAQAMGNAQHMICDNIAAKGSVRRPQGEFWAKHQHGCYDIKEASSSAHLYGKQIASAEAFTDAKYSQSLSYLKTLADYAFAFHLNELVVCASAYQPWLDKVPGNTANGREYCLNRNNSMWPLSNGFWDYQARCAYLMRQGRPVVDLCIYLGSDVPNKILSHRLPSIPEGYDWDVCTDDALLRLLSARDGRLQAAAGMSYSVLVVERLASLSAEAEGKLAQLKASGLHVYDARVAGDFALQSFLDSIGLQPDVRFRSANLPENRLFFAHRRVEAAGTMVSRALAFGSNARALASGSNARKDFDIYFFSNHSAEAFSQELVFRDSQGKVAEFWNPLDAQRYRLPSSENEDGNLQIHLNIAPDEAGFIVLRHPDTMPLASLYRSDNYSDSVIAINDDWQVDFLLAKDTLSLLMPELCDWTLLDDDRLKYHSGRAIYHRVFDFAKTTENRRVFLRLSGLHAAASLRINGQVAGAIWCSPWEIDVTDYLQEGQNAFEIQVANQLSNRMIGDLDLPEDERVTFATTPIVKPGDALLPAGITDAVELIFR